MSNPTQTLDSIRAAGDDTVALAESWRSTIPRTGSGRLAPPRAVPGSRGQHLAAAALASGSVDAATLASLTAVHDADALAMFTEDLPVDVLRRALAGAYLDARLGDDRAALREVETAARNLEARREAVVEGLLDDFAVNFPELQDRIVAVVEGGATRNDPESRGIFGDVDMTVFTVDERGALGRVSDAIARSFAWSGFPLSAGGQNRPLDLHVFVQCVRSGTAAAHGTGAPVHGVSGDLRLAVADPYRLAPLRRRIGARNPERFVTEVGVRWVVNQMYFGGRQLRGCLESACVPAPIGRDEAVRFARDVSCHLGPSLLEIAAGADTDAGDDEGPAGDRRRLAACLDDAKHVLRMVDAWLIAQPGGNERYLARFSGPRSQYRDASYHAMVVEDAIALVRSGRGDGTLRLADAPLLNTLAALKLRTRYPTPWDLLGHGEAGLRRARAIVGETGDLLRRLLRALD